MPTAVASVRSVRSAAAELGRIGGLTLRPHVRNRWFSAVVVRGREYVLKQVLIQADGCNLGLFLRSLTGIGTPRSLQGRTFSAVFGLIRHRVGRW